MRSSFGGRCDRRARRGLRAADRAPRHPPRAGRDLAAGGLRAHAWSTRAPSRSSCPVPYAAGRAVAVPAGVIIVVGALVAIASWPSATVDPAGDAVRAARLRRPRLRGGARTSARPGWMQTEIWPLLLFAVGGMMLFVAANDLLTMFVALEVMSLPLYLLHGHGAPTAPAVAGGGAEVLHPRRLLLGVLHLRRRAALRLLRLGEPQRHHRAPGGPARRTTGLLLAGGGACCWSACCSRSRPCRSTRGPPTPTRAPRRW